MTLVRLVHLIFLAATLPTAAFAGGRCVPGPYTQSYQAPFCTVVTDGPQHCQVVGCEWVYQNYGQPYQPHAPSYPSYPHQPYYGGGRCVPGPYTQSYQAPFCTIVTDGAQHCQTIGCEWIR